MMFNDSNISRRGKYLGKVQGQITDFLTYKKNKEAEEANAKALKETEELYSNVRLSNGSKIFNTKNRIHQAEQKATFIERSLNYGLESKICDIVEQASLVEHVDMEKVRETVKTLLENSNLENDNKTFNLILESVSKAIPDVSVVTCLTESEQQKQIDAQIKKENKIIDQKIAELVGDIKEKVAEVVAADQSKAEELEAEISDVINSQIEANTPAEEAEVEPVAIVPLDDEGTKFATLDGTEVEVAIDDDGNISLADGTPAVITDEEGNPIPMDEETGDGVETPAAGDILADEKEPTPNEAAMDAIDAAAGNEEEAPVEGEEVQAEEVPAEEIPAEVVEAPANSDKDISINVSPDGSININISKLNPVVTEAINNALVRDIPKSTLLECLAVNEGMEMIKKGEPYDGEKAVANAVTYVTILETFNALGLMDLTEGKVRDIIAAFGGKAL